MNAFVEAVRYGLENLLVFDGRDPKALFWRYAATVLLVGMILYPIASLLLFMTFYRPLEGEGADGFQAAMVSFVVLSVLVTLFTIASLASAIARRLHDVGWPAYIGLVPIPFLLMGFYTMTHMMASGLTSEVDAGLFALGFFSSMIYIASLAGLVVLLCRDSEADDNIHGPLQQDQ